VVRPPATTPEFTPDTDFTLEAAVAKHKDRVGWRPPVGVLRVDRAENGPVRRGQPWCYRVQLMVRGQRLARRFDSDTPLDAGLPRVMSRIA